MTSLQKLKSLLTAADQKKLILLLVPMSLSALINIIGIAFVMPFITVLSNPAIVQTSKKLNFIYHYFAFTQFTHFAIFLGVLALVMLVLANSMSALTLFLSGRTIAGVRARLTQTLYEKYLDKDYEYHLNHNSSTISNNLFVLVDKFTQGFLWYGMQVVTNLISITAIVALVIFVNPLMALIMTGVLGGSYAVIYLLIKKKLSHDSKLIVSSTQEAQKLASESFGGIKDIKLKGNEQTFKRLFYPHIAEYTRCEATELVFGSLPKYALEMVAFGGVIAVMLFMLLSGYNVSAIIPLVAIYVYSGYRLMPALQQVFIGVTSIKMTSTSLNMVYDSVQSDEHDTSCAQPNPSIEPNSSIENIKFSNQFKIDKLTYKYKGGDRIVLDDVSLSINHNEIVGVIGTTGAGKTTLIDIILGLLKPTSGMLFVDNVALDNQAKVAVWQKLMGYVPQHIYLSDSTIRENIAFGEDIKLIKQSDIERAAKIAAIHDFIVNELPEGYDTVVGERGVKLSGGQLQRIGIARALYRKPSVLVLDEATSSLDMQTEADVMKAIYNMRDKITIIIIAHRLSTVACCDRVVLMGQGKILDEGKFSELSSRNERMLVVPK